MSMIKKYFGSIPAADQPEKPDLTEPRQEESKRFTKKDPLANRPALAFSYQTPERNTPEYFAMGLLDQILMQGDDSRFYQTLVQKKGLTGSVDGGINLLGNMFNYNGPMLWIGYLYHDHDIPADTILTAIESVIRDVQNNPISQANLDRALIKIRSDFYDQMSRFYGFGRADLLASFALFDDDPSRINTLEAQFRAVTPELMLNTAREYLLPEARTLLIIEPETNS